MLDSNPTYKFQIIFFLITMLFYPFSTTTHAAVFKEIYRSPSSPFPSGQVKTEDLIKSKIGQKNHSWVLIEIEGLKTWVQHEVLYLNNDLESTAEHLIRAYSIKPIDLYSSPDLLKKPIGRINTGSEIFLTYKQIPNTPSSQTNSKPNFWFEIQIGKNLYYILNPQMVTSLDASLEIKTKSAHLLKNIAQENFRYYGFLAESSDKLSFRLDEVMNFKLDLKRGFLRSDLNKLGHSQTKSFPAGSKVTILDQRDVLWNQSQLSDHGEVWWLNETEDENIKLNSNSKFSSKIKLSQLLKKNVVDFAFEKNLLKKEKNILALSSAQGIWLSDDGDNWHKIKQFENHDYAVAVTKEGTLLVDSYYSRDYGNSFEKFLRLDQLAALTWRKRREHPKYLQIKKIDLPNNSQNQIKLLIDMGLKSNIYIQVSLEQNKIQWLGDEKSIE